MTFSDLSFCISVHLLQSVFNASGKTSVNLIRKQLIFTPNQYHENKINNLQEKIRINHTSFVSF